MNKPRYSIWLVPAAPARQQFSQAIIDLAAKYQSPWFVPHMTVLADNYLDIDTLVQKLTPVAQQTSKLSIQIDHLEIGQKYYQCMYAKLIKSPALTDLYTNTCNALDQPADSNWLAHMSLLYGEFDDTIKLAAQKDARSMMLPNIFETDSLSIWLSGPDPEKWQEIKNLNFVQ